MSQQSDMADAVYDRLCNGPIPLATLVKELRDRWGDDHGVSGVHHFVSEVVTCLLHREDVEIGDTDGGKYVAWTIEPWDASDKVEAELAAMDQFLEDETRFVFRKTELVSSPKSSESDTMTYTELFRRHRLSLLALWLLPPATLVAGAYGHLWIQIIIPLCVFAAINAMIRLQKSGASRDATLTLCMIVAFVIWCVAVFVNVLTLPFRN